MVSNNQQIHIQHQPEIEDFDPLWHEEKVIDETDQCTPWNNGSSQFEKSISEGSVCHLPE